ncbi:hypothetical protein evm_015115 [Chilo suppressalis]|nr:hypothetical protein evm_015115 [Chilo suppressalis]
MSLSNVENKTKTEDSYVFEAGYMLNLAARCEDMGDYQRAFDCYKSGIEKMLIGVQSDTDPQRRALIKEKTNKYLSYAETIYKNHLSDTERSYTVVTFLEEKLAKYRIDWQFYSARFSGDFGGSWNPKCYQLLYLPAAEIGSNADATRKGVEYSLMRQMESSPFGRDGEALVSSIAYKRARNGNKLL